MILGIYGPFPGTVYTKSAFFRKTVLLHTGALRYVARHTGMPVCYVARHTPAGGGVLLHSKTVFLKKVLLVYTVPGKGP